MLICNPSTHVVINKIGTLQDNQSWSFPGPAGVQVYAILRTHVHSKTEPIIRASGIHAILQKTLNNEQ